MELEIHTYKKGDVEKTYTATEYDLMFGTVEDLLNIIDVDNVESNIELTKMIVKGMKQIKPLLLEVFDGVTEEELRRVPMKELIPCVIGLVKCAMDEVTNTFNGGKK